MLFANTELATRIEGAESRLRADAAVAVADHDEAADVLVMPIAGGVATHVGYDSPLNKVAGLGFGGPVEASALEAVEEAFARRRTPVQVELCCLAAPEVGTLLSRRGYELSSFENVLGRALPASDLPRPAPGIAVSVSDRKELGAWLKLLVTAFVVPDAQGVPAHDEFPREALERVIEAMAGTPGFSRYMARLDGQPAGGGSMRIDDEIVLLCGAATLPTYRRRGVQSALLSERLSHAAEAGCKLAIVTTLPGSKSQENVQRQGFEPLYTRAVMIKPFES